MALPADADLPVRFIVALQELIREIRDAGAGQRYYEIEQGKFYEKADDKFLYRFPFVGEEDEVRLFEDAQVKVRVEERWLYGTIVSIGAGHLILALGEYIGDEVRSARLQINTTALLEALKKKIEDVKGGAIVLNRTLADAVVRPGPPPKMLGRPIPANGGHSLNDAQRKAYENALREALTFIWGPPGCGKTKILSEIARSVLENQKRALICSNTNKSVDQALYQLCAALKIKHPAMKEGKIIRLGRVIDDKLA